MELYTNCDSLVHYKVRWTVIINCDSFFYDKVRHAFYYKLRRVLQSAMDLLEIATGITKCDGCYKLRQYRRRKSAASHSRPTCRKTPLAIRTLAIWTIF